MRLTFLKPSVSIILVISPLYSVLDAFPISDLGDNYTE
jgi:hypothetical protein